MILFADEETEAQTHPAGGHSTASRTTGIPTQLPASVPMALTRWPGTPLK